MVLLLAPFSPLLWFLSCHLVPSCSAVRLVSTGFTFAGTDVSSAPEFASRMPADQMQELFSSLATTLEEKLFQRMQATFGPPNSIPQGSHSLQLHSDRPESPVMDPSSDDEAASVYSDRHSHSQEHSSFVPSSSGTHSSSDTWQTIPQQWLQVQTEKGWQVLRKISEEPGSSFAPVEGVELKEFDVEGKIVVKWRVRRSSKDPPPHARARDMADALASLSVLLQGDPALASVQRSESSGRIPGLALTNPPPSSLPSWADLTAWWQAKALKSPDKPPSANMDGQRVHLSWPEGSMGYNLTKFLSPQRLSTQWPADFKKLSQTDLNVDAKARTGASRSFALTSLLDVTADFARKAVQVLDTRADFSVEHVLRHLATVLEGLASISAPIAMSQVEEAIARRLELRLKAIPPKWKSASQDLLVSDPFHPQPWGDNGVVQTARAKVPEPMQLTLPPAFFKALSSSSRGGRHGTPSDKKARHQRVHPIKRKHDAENRQEPPQKKKDYDPSSHKRAPFRGPRGQRGRSSSSRNPVGKHE